MIRSNGQMTESSETLGQAHCRAKVLEHVSDNDMARCFSRYENEEHCPSRVDGIYLAKENELRKSYCVFLRDLGCRLRMPFHVVATSTVFCHRFYLHQSHQKNDRYIIATACMFLAGKVEEARRALDDVVYVSYFIQNKNNPAAAEAFKDKDVCEKQKELVLLAEQVVLVTLDFNLEVSHPHDCIPQVTSKLRADKILVDVSNIILNDVMYTTLCLNFEPEQIAVTALLVAAKLLKFKFPYKGWWREHVTFQQLEEIYSQIVEFYERERGKIAGKHNTGIPLANGKESSNANFSGIKTKLKVKSETKSLAPLKRKKTEEDCIGNSQQSRYIKGSVSVAC